MSTRSDRNLKILGSMRGGTWREGVDHELTSTNVDSLCACETMTRSACTSNVCFVTRWTSHEALDLCTQLLITDRVMIWK